MSQVQVTIVCEKEILDLAVPLCALIADIKAKKSALEIAADSLSKLIGVVMELPSIPADVVTDPEGSVNAIGQLGWQVYQAAIAPAPAAVK